MSNLISAQEAVAKIVDSAIRNVLSGEQKLTKEYEQSVKEAVNVILDTAKRTDGDLISRQAAIDAVEKESQIDGAYGYMDTKSIVDLLSDLPSAQQDCTDCPEYDTERHSCPRYCEVIRQTLEEAQPQRKTGKWIIVDDGCISGKCSVCGWEAHMYEDDVVGMDYCPNCGARLEGEG